MDCDADVWDADACDAEEVCDTACADDVCDVCVDDDAASEAVGARANAKERRMVYFMAWCFGSVA